MELDDKITRTNISKLDKEIFFWTMEMEKDTANGNTFLEGEYHKFCVTKINELIAKKLLEVEKLTKPDNIKKYND